MCDRNCRAKGSFLKTLLFSVAVHILVFAFVGIGIISAQGPQKTPRVRSYEVSLMNLPMDTPDPEEISRDEAVEIPKEMPEEKKSFVPEEIQEKTSSSRKEVLTAEHTRKPPPSLNLPRQDYPGAQSVPEKPSPPAEINQPGTASADRIREEPAPPPRDREKLSSAEKASVPITDLPGEAVSEELSPERDVAGELPEGEENEGGVPWAGIEPSNIDNIHRGTAGDRQDLFAGSSVRGNDGAGSHESDKAVDSGSGSGNMAPVDGDENSPLAGDQEYHGPGGSINPAFPRGARERGESGTVVVLVQILPSGRAGEVNLVRSSGYTSLDDAVLEKARSARFTPAKRGDLPVESQKRFVVNFELEDFLD